MEVPLSRPPSPLPPPSEPLSPVDFLPFDRDTRLEEKTEFLDCCSLEYNRPGKITIVSTQPRLHHPLHPLSPDDCELDQSYSEIVEAPWTKGSRSDGGGSCGHSCRSSLSEASGGGGCRRQEIGPHELGSDTESVVVSAPLHNTPATVRCVCVCKKRSCKFVEKPFDVESVRASPTSGVSLGYRLVTWLSAFVPQRRGTDSPLATDQIDVAVKVHPEKRSKLIQVLKCGQWRGHEDRCPGEALGQCHALGCGKRVPLRGCQVSVPRTIGVVLGVVLVLMGMTYDHGIKHGVDDLLQDCWSWLRTSYMNFGDEFVSYNSIFFRMSNTEVLYGEPYPNYGNKTGKKPAANATSFQEAIKKVDPKFLYVLEGLKLSVQLHFFSIDERSDEMRQKVLVHDRGPLFFRISFRRTVGLQIDYLRRRSNMSLTTPFQIYDLMKLTMVSNGLPYFGMHMHDFIQTTPSALFTMIINNLKKFKVDTTFLSGIQAQIQKGRRFRRDAEKEVGKENGKPSVTVPAAPTTITTRESEIPLTVVTERPKTTTSTVWTTSAAGTTSSRMAATVLSNSTTTETSVSSRTTGSITNRIAVKASVSSRTTASLVESSITTKASLISRTTNSIPSNTRDAKSLFSPQATNNVLNNSRTTKTSFSSRTADSIVENTLTTNPSLSSSRTTTSSVSNSTTTKASYSSILERIRRSTEEPSLRQIAWRSLTEISKKIFLPLPLDTKKSVLLPVPFIEKNLTLKYRHSVNVLGLPGYQFVLGNDITKNGSPWGGSLSDLYPSLSYSRVKDGENQDASNSHRHRFNDKRKHHRHSKHQNGLESDSYRKSFNDVLGVVDLQPLLLESIGKVFMIDHHLKNYPFWLSPPHFLSLTDHIEATMNREKYPESKNQTGDRSKDNNTSSKNLLIGVEGVQANESVHGSFIYYHPILGVPINASLAVQVGIRPPEGMLHAHKLVPIMWARIQVEEIPRTLWYILWAACHLRETIMGCFICSGLLIIICSLTCRRKKKKKKKALEQPDNSA